YSTCKCHALQFWGIHRNTKGPKDFCLFITVTPIPRRNKCSLPQATLLTSRNLLNQAICGGVLHIGKCPTLCTACFGAVNFFVVHFGQRAAHRLFRGIGAGLIVLLP